MRKNMYELMGIKQDATPAQIKEAYKQLYNAYQEKYYQGDPNAQLYLFNLDESKHTLLSPEKRLKHDEWLANNNSQTNVVSEEQALKYNEITNQLVSIGVSSSTISRKEIKELPKVLIRNERIEQVIIGSIEGDHYGLSGVIIATEWRLVYVEKQPFGITVVEIYYDKIKTIQYDVRARAIEDEVVGEIVLILSNKKITILCDSEITDRFANFIHSKTSADLEEYKTNAKPISKTEKITDLIDEKSEHNISCPICGHKQIATHPKGFSPLKALGGLLIPGGILWGFHGKNKVIITCLKCGHNWTP